MGIKKTLCWEELDGYKMNKRITGTDGKKVKARKLQKAMDKCLDLQSERDCTGVFWAGKTHYMSAATKAKKSTKEGHKSWRLVPCEESCEKNEKRCADGECRASCSGEDKEDKEKEDKEKEDQNGECPAGTMKCSDGICRHEHM